MIPKAKFHALVAICGAACRVCAGGVLLWYGLSGVSRPYENLRSIFTCEMLSPSVGIAVAMVAPWLEVVFGACLVANLFRAGAWIGSLLLLGMVTLLEAPWQ